MLQYHIHIISKLLSSIHPWCTQYPHHIRTLLSSLVLADELYIYMRLVYYKSSKFIMDESMLSLVLVAFPLLLLFIFRKHKTSKKKPNLPPGPRGLPFIGNLHQLNSSSLHLNLYELSKKHGSLFSLKLGSRQAIVVSSAEMAKEVTKTHDVDFCSRPSFISQMKFSYDGLDMIFSPYRDYWRHTRKLSIIHFLSLKRVLAFSSVRKYEVYMIFLFVHNLL